MVIMATLIYAHRGSSAYRIENTMPSFELAAEQGADGVELDVQLTSDGVAVVCHDETVNRIWNGKGPVKNFTFAQLRELRAKKAKSDTKVYIPTLSEVLRFCAEAGMRMNIELKNSIEPYPGLEEVIIDLVETSSMKDRVIYSSFNHESLLLVKSLDSSARVGLLFSEIMVSPWLYAKNIGANAIHPAQNSLCIPNLIESCHDNGIDINLWTVDEPKIIRLCLDQGADGIITNMPDVALRPNALF
jgi:glycerophosphoryl diester phosphodiesterase